MDYGIGFVIAIVAIPCFTVFLIRTISNWRHEQDMLKWDSAHYYLAYYPNTTFGPNVMILSGLNESMAVEFAEQAKGRAIVMYVVECNYCANTGVQQKVNWRGRIKARYCPHCKDWRDPADLPKW